MSEPRIATRMRIMARARRRQRTEQRKRVAALSGLFVSVLFGVLFAAAGAFAYWTISVITGSGSYALAQADALVAPAGPTVTVDGSGAITVGWTAPGTQVPGTEYQVTRTSGPGSPSTVCTVSAGPCQDTGLSPGTSYGYSITAVLGQWVSSAITTSTTTATPTFSITLSPGSLTAGSPITVTGIEAMIGADVDTTYAGAKTLQWSGLVNSPSGQTPSYPTTAVTFVNGVASPGSTFTAYAAGSNALTATDAHAVGVTGSATFTLDTAPVERLTFTTVPVSGAASSTAAIGPLTVEEQDHYGNPTTTAETVGLSSDTSGTAVFSAALNGSPVTSVDIPGGSSTATFYYGDTRTGAPKITAGAGGLTDATQHEAVTAGAAAKLAFTPAAPAPGTAGAPLSNVTVSVEDLLGNVVTSQDSGSVTLSVAAGAPQPGFTSGTTTISVSHGVADFTDLVVDNAGTYTFSATPGGISGATAVNSDPFTVSPGTIAGIVLSNVTTSPGPPLISIGSVGSLSYASANEANTTNLTLVSSVTLVDQFGNPVNAPSTQAIDLNVPATGTYSEGTVNPSGANALTIPSGATTSTVAFTLVRHNGNNKTVVLTATLHGTTKMLTVTLSS